MKRSDEAFATGFDHLRGFVAARGHARVPIRYRIPDGYPLGHWVSWQRHRARTGAMTPEQSVDLMRLGFQLDGRRARLDAALAFARQWAQHEGSLAGLGYDVRTGEIPVRATLLDALRWHRLTFAEQHFVTGAGLRYRSRDAAWHSQLAQLEAFYAAYGRPPRLRKREPLASWRHEQFSALRHGRLSPERASALTDLENRLDSGLGMCPMPVPKPVPAGAPSL